MTTPLQLGDEVRFRWGLRSARWRVLATVHPRWPEATLVRCTKAPVGGDHSWRVGTTGWVRAKLEPTSENLPPTPRQMACLRAYALTGSYQHTAHRLGIAIPTLRIHLSTAYARLDADNAIEAFTAIGWLQVPDQ